MKKKIVIIFLIISGLYAGFYLINKNQAKVIEFSKNLARQEAASLSANDGNLTPDPNLPMSPISGLNCDNAQRRPIAVMMSSDSETRPLSGLSEADMVIEMQVVENSVTRMMAVYVCGNPKEIGSIRSAREDFIPLARGLDAILVHWGGEHSALEKLDRRIMDNLDGLKDEVITFFRKAGIPMPHNGFSSITRLIKGAGKKGYNLESEFIGYPHVAGQSKQNKAMNLTIDYIGPFAVKYEYDPSCNCYRRWRGGAKEMDKNNGQQVLAKNVIIMRAVSKALNEQYNSVQVEGGGRATIYRNGEEISGTWKKDIKNQTSKLFFYDEAGREIEFVPGQIWVEVVDLNQNVVWQ